MRDLLWFVIILLVFVFAYAIASEALLYPNSEVNGEFLYKLPRKAYWHIYGELFMSDIEGTCDNDTAGCTDPNERHPSDVGRYAVPALLGLYMLFTNVLLINLLIAKFSYTIQRIQESSKSYWCFQRFILVNEYTQRPFLPPPLIFFVHAAYIARWITRCCKKPKDEEKKETAFFRHFEEEKKRKLIYWEKEIAQDHLRPTEKKISDHITSERLEIFMNKAEDIHEHSYRLDNIEKRLTDITETFNHNARSVVKEPSTKEPEITDNFQAGASNLSKDTRL